MGRSSPSNWDAVVAITRDYLDDPVRGTRCTWHIEADDPPRRWREDDADLARRFHAAVTWVRDQFTMVRWASANRTTSTSPTRCSRSRSGGAAGDAAYAMGSFDLGPDEALVIRGRSPECAFWNLCLWNQFMHTYNYDYERCTINGSQVVPEADESWTLVVADHDPGHPTGSRRAGTPVGGCGSAGSTRRNTAAAPTTEVVDRRRVPAPPRREAHAGARCVVGRRRAGSAPAARPCYSASSATPNWVT